MRVISIDNLEVPAGELILFRPQTGTPAPSAVPPSFNQRYHVAGSGETGGWLGATFELTSVGALDLTALESAFRALVDAHETLATSFVRDREDVVRVMHATSESWTRESVAITGAGAERRAQLQEIIDAHTRPCDFPAYLLGVLCSGDVTTVITAFNHVHVDAVSLTVVVEDLLAAYRGATLAQAPSHLAHCAETPHPDTASSTGLGAGTARWHAFLDTHRGLPRFPADLGLEPGERAPQRVVITRLLGARPAAAADERCRAAGGRMSAGVLAACAQALACANHAAPDHLATLLPVATRRDQRWARSLGWFVTNVPLEVPVTRGVTDGISAAQAALDRALELVDVPIPHVLGTYPRALDLDRDLFMLSYLDYRRVASTGVLSEHNAQHVSASAPTDDVQVWFSRDDAGLAVRVRMPDTAFARIAVDLWLERVSTHLQSLSHDPERSVAWR